MSNSLLAGLSGPLSAFNRHRLWSGQRNVWGRQMSVPSADRHLYATLHQWGFMGKEDRRFYEETVRPGMHVLDIGANIGVFTLLLARLAGPGGTVRAFEPAPDLYRALAASCAANDAANVTTFPFGLGEVDEDRPLRRSAFNSGDNRVSADASADEAGTERIRLRRGDGLLPAPITADFIKIDVQGWELHALRGLRELIARSERLEIYLEYWPEGLRSAGTEPSALLAFLRGEGLTILRPLPDAGWGEADGPADIEGSLSRAGFTNLRALKGQAVPVPSR